MKSKAVPKKAKYLIEHSFEKEIVRGETPQEDFVIVRCGKCGKSFQRFHNFPDEKSLAELIRELGKCR